MIQIKINLCKLISFLSDNKKHHYKGNMLKFEDFYQLDKTITGFKFQQLHFVNSNSAQQMYSDGNGNSISIIQYDSIEQVKVIDTLAKCGVLLNYCGTLQRQRQKQIKFFIFYHVGKFTDIVTLSEKLLVNNQRIDERFCIQFFQSFIYMLNQLQKLGQYIKIINPASIGLRNPQSQSNKGFGLLLPFSFRFFNCILKVQYEQNIKFIAPEIIRYFVANPHEQICYKEYRKAGLYSLGLILLSCFGYSFTVKQRLQSSRNDKQFRTIFKKIRKQIKILHTGKFVSKSLKLLLEDCQKSRQIIQTFTIKVHSPQMSSLKICKDTTMNDYRFYSTISDSNKSEIAQKIHKTINIQINSNTSPLTITPQNLGKSNKNKTSFGQYPLNSPINIDVSFDDDTPSQNKSRVSNFKIQRMSQQIMTKIQKVTDDPETHQQILQNMKDKQFSQQKIIQKAYRQHEQQQVYSYNINELQLRENQSHTDVSRYNEREKNEGDSVFMDKFQLIDHENFDEKSVLRRKFQNQTKIIMATLLISFFIYGIVGYLRQNS